MKVLMVNTLGLQTGGITVSMLNYIREIDREEIEIDITSTMESDDEVIKQFQESCCKIYRLEHRKNNLFRYLMGLYKVLKSNSYDIIHVHGNSATIFFELITAFLAGVKIRIAHSHNTTCDYKKVDKLLRPFFYFFCNGRFACGKDAGKWLFGKKDFQIIYNGIDINKFKFDINSRNKIRKKLSIKNDDVLLGNVGNLNTQKNQKFLIYMMEDLKVFSEKYKLIIIGNGDLEIQLKSKVKELNLQENIIFAGHINNVYEYLSALDYMIMPSLYEGFPVTLVEAQVSGLQCLISDRITEEVVSTDLVSRIPLNTTSKWIEKITKTKLTVNRESYFEIMGNKGFTIIENAKKLQNQYIQLVKNIRR